MPMRWIIRLLQCLTGGGNQVNFIVTKSYPTTDPPLPLTHRASKFGLQV